MDITPREADILTLHRRITEQIPRCAIRVHAGAIARKVRRKCGLLRRVRLRRLSRCKDAADTNKDTFIVVVGNPPDGRGGSAADNTNIIIVDPPDVRIIGSASIIEPNGCEHTLQIAVEIEPSVGVVANLVLAVVREVTFDLLLHGMVPVVFDAVVGPVVEEQRLELGATDSTKTNVHVHINLSSI